jgi:hypothetical protein
MAEAKPLRRDATGLAEFGTTDTFPATSLPARLTISPSQITGDQDNYNPTGFSTAEIVRLDFDTGGRAITGFTAWTSGRPKTIVNISGNFGYIPCEHPDSTAANRVIGSFDHMIAPYGTLIIEYDSTSSRVRVLGNSFNAATPGIGNLRAHFYQLSVGSVTAADWGNFAFAVAGTAAALSTTGATSTLPGSWTIGTGSTSTGAANMYLSKNIVNPTFFGAAHIIASCGVYFPTLSDGTHTYTFSFGLIPTPSSTTLDVNNSVVIKYSHGLNSGKFLGVSRATGGGESTPDLGITVAANTLYVLTVCFDKAISEARFYVDGVMVGRATASMPSGVAVGVRAIIVKSVGATARTAAINTITLSTVY